MMRGQPVSRCDALEPAVRLRAASRLWLDVLAVAGSGVLAAVIGELLGRALHLLWPVAASGSIAAALPRAVVYLLLVTRVRSFGALTGAACSEVATRLAMGAIGLMPWFLVVPVLGNFAGDVTWACARRLAGQRTRLMLTGAALSVGRVLAALAFWWVLGPLVRGMGAGSAAVLGLIVGANVLLGSAAGLIVNSLTQRLRRARAV
jgi:hypothetical protein